MSTASRLGTWDPGIGTRDSCDRQQDNSSYTLRWVAYFQGLMWAEKLGR